MLEGGLVQSGSARQRPELDQGKWLIQRMISMQLFPRSALRGNVRHSEMGDPTAPSRHARNPEVARFTPGVVREVYLFCFAPLVFGTQDVV